MNILIAKGNNVMYEIVFYKDKKGNSEIEELLENLQQSSSKNDRINRIKILSHINALSTYGTRAGEKTTKHLQDEIWELRPLKNRILYFYWQDDKFVLLHHFVKKTQKTPKRELEQAKSKMNDFIERSELK